jgi:hypothetical protein
MKYLFFLFLAIPSSILFAQTPEISLSKGLVIKESCRITPGKYAIAPTSEKETCITVSGENLVDRFPEC